MDILKCFRLKIMIKTNHVHRKTPFFIRFFFLWKSHSVTKNHIESHRSMDERKIRLFSMTAIWNLYVVLNWFIFRSKRREKMISVKIKTLPLINWIADWLRLWDCVYSYKIVSIVVWRELIECAQSQNSTHFVFLLGKWWKKMHTHTHLFWCRKIIMME